MRTIHLHPEHYLGVELIPLFSRGDIFCRKGMEHIARLYPNIDAWHTKGLRGSGAITAMAMSGYTLAVAINDILPRFDRVLHGYDEHHHEHTRSSQESVPRFIAFGESSTFAVFAEMNDMAGIEQLWIVADMLDERMVRLAHRALTALTRDYHLGIADWHWKEFIDTRDSAALHAYLMRRYTVAVRGSHIPVSHKHTAHTTSAKTWWQWWK
jgi:hypothetical protein